MGARSKPHAPGPRGQAAADPGRLEAAAAAARTAAAELREASREAHGLLGDLRRLYRDLGAARDQMLEELASYTRAHLEEALNQRAETVMGQLQSFVTDEIECSGAMLRRTMTAMQRWIVDHMIMRETVSDPAAGVIRVRFGVEPYPDLFDAPRDGPRPGTRMRARQLHRYSAAGARVTDPADAPPESVIHDLREETGNAENGA